jgi:hypothetical protein
MRDGQAGETIAVQDFAWVNSPPELGLRVRLTRPAGMSTDLTTEVWLPKAAAAVTWSFDVVSSLTTPTVLVIEHAYQPGDTPDPGEAQGRATLWITAVAAGVTLPPAGPLVLKIRPSPHAYPGP